MKWLLVLLFVAPFIFASREKSTYVVDPLDIAQSHDLSAQFTYFNGMIENDHVIHFGNHIKFKYTKKETVYYKISKLTQSQNTTCTSGIDVMWMDDGDLAKFEKGLTFQYYTQGSSLNVNTYEHAQDLAVWSGGPPYYLVIRPHPVSHCTAEKTLDIRTTFNAGSPRSKITWGTLLLVILVAMLF
eukprot:gnl/Trimastix_PCT/1882.p1 GENE.gnl/Trimastix_PCT/1882~~gnl/Trimastix_PCT/1882.p1  ORF type:complete len:185 (+),score=23.94 gnl/Trimastix_PCT/1882:22-576(+)